MLSAHNLIFHILIFHLMDIIKILSILTEEIRILRRDLESTELVDEKFAQIKGKFRGLLIEMNAWKYKKANNISEIFVITQSSIYKIIALFLIRKIKAAFLFIKKYLNIISNRIFYLYLKSMKKTISLTKRNAHIHMIITIIFQKIFHYRLLK